MLVTETKHHSSMPYLLFKELRPKQWTKNLVIFAAWLFSYKKLSWSMLYQTLLGFFLFCLISGSVYILNDFLDREKDRNHPDKKYRPIASRELNPYIALTFCGLIVIMVTYLAFALNLYFGLLIIAYFLLNLAYSFQLKHVVILDVMVISLGFVLRAVGGGLIVGVPFTPWFLLCISLLALFLALSKRRHEMVLLQNEMGSHRKVLEHYSIELLDQLISIVTTATILCYSIFTFTSGHSIYLMASIPFVIYGIFRYLYLIHMEDAGEKPEQVLLHDKHIIITVILYTFTVFLSINYFY